MEDDVLRLQVPVQDVVVVHVLHCVANLLYHPANPLLPHPPLHLHTRVQAPRKAQLHQQVEIAVLDKHRVELHDVGVVQVGLDFDFADPLGEVVVVVGYVLVRYPLERADEVGSLVPAY